MAAQSGFSFVFSAASVSTALKSRQRRRKAKKLLKKVKIARFAAKRRSFLADFRAKQQELLLAGGREGGLGSSQFQGQRASLQTQAAARLGEFEDTTRIQREAEGFIESAERFDEQTALFQQAGQATSVF